jgi:DNA-binding response OmpR family regulator
MPTNDTPTILLLTDDGAEESHTTHILGKYHFTNRLLKFHNAIEAIKFFSACNQPDRNPPEALPELIILSLRDSGRFNLSIAMESRRDRMGRIPLILVLDSREEEEGIRKLGLVNTAWITRPIGFFKLLEAMQKLNMGWIVLRPNP